MILEGKQLGRSTLESLQNGMGCWGIWTVLYGCKGQLFPLSLWRNAGLSLALPHESSEGAGGGGRDGCDVAGSSKKKERKFFPLSFFFLSFFSFIASPFLPPGFDLGWGWGCWKKSTKFWFGEVVDDHVQQQVPMGQTEESLAQTTAV